MSTSVAELITRLNEQVSGKANDVAKALGHIAASEDGLKSFNAALKRRAASVAPFNTASQRFAALSGANGRASRAVGRGATHLTSYQAQALVRNAVMSAA